MLSGVGAAVLLRAGAFQWKPELSADGVATLAGGALAFLAVMIQLEGERNFRAEETVTRRRAVLTALLVEIDDFYRYVAKDLHRRMMCWYPNGTVTALPDAPELGLINRTAFLLYESNAQEVGSLDSKVTRSVVGVYNFMANFVDAYETYRRAWQSCSGRSVDPKKMQDIWDCLPALILNIHDASKTLANELKINLGEAGFNSEGIGETLGLLREQAAAVTRRLKHEHQEADAKLSLDDTASQTSEGATVPPDFQP